MSFHDSKLSKYVTKLSKFLKFPVIPTENSLIPGNSRGNSWDGGFPVIPEREFPLALHLTNLSGSRSIGFIDSEHNPIFLLFVCF